MGNVAAEKFGTLATALENAERLSSHNPALAIEQLHEILRALPGHSPTQAMLGGVYRSLGDRFTVSGDSVRASAAYAEAIRHSVHDPVLRNAAAALCQNNLPVAEQLLRNHLKSAPTDVAAIRMLAEVGARLGRHGDAEKLLCRAIQLAPDFEAARHNYAIVLYRQQKMAEALREITWLLERDPKHA